VIECGHVSGLDCGAAHGRGPVWRCAGWVQDQNSELKALAQAL